MKVCRSSIIVYGLWRVLFFVTENHSVPLLDRCFKTWYLLPTQNLRKRHSENFCYGPDKQNHRMVKAGNHLWRVSSRFSWRRSHSTMSTWVLISKDGDSTSFLTKQLLCSLTEQQIHLLYLYFAEVISDVQIPKHLLNDFFFISFFYFLSTFCWLMLWSFQFLYCKKGVDINFHYCSAHRIIRSSTCK